jgi:MFS family permease
VHYKRLPLAGLTLSLTGLVALAIWPTSMPFSLVLMVLFVIGGGLGTVFPVSTVCMQNAVAHAQMGIATGAANFFRALFSSLVVAILGAIVLGGLGGATGMSVDALAHAASQGELAHAFRFVFLTAALVLSFGLAFLIALEERPLRGPGPSASADIEAASVIPVE